MNTAKETSKLTYDTASLRLLDLLDALYTRVPHVFDDETVAKLRGPVANGNEAVETGQYLPESDNEGLWCEGGLLWQLAWRSLLQGEQYLPMLQALAYLAGNFHWAVKFSVDLHINFYCMGDSVHAPPVPQNLGNLFTLVKPL